MATNQDWPSLSDLPDGGEEAAVAAAVLDPEMASAADLLSAGLQIARGGGLDQAAEIFAKAILKEPSSAEAYEALATVLVPLGKLEFAIRAKAKAISLGYNSAASWEMLGDMLFSVGQFEEAAEAFATAVDLEPGMSELQNKLHLSRSRSPAQKRMTSSDTTRSSARPNTDLFGPEFLSADPIPPAWRHVSIVTITPDGNPHSAAFDDLTSGIEEAAKSLGIEAERRSNSFGNSGINLLLGAHLIGSQELADRVPWNTVILNLEQVTGFDVRARPIYMSLLNRLAVWDYSVRNIDELRRLTKSPYVRHFAIGYTPGMTRRVEMPAQTTDVLFYGSLNARRRAVLEALIKAGLNVKHLFSVYGAARDQAIAEAKVVLNMHFYEDSIHEIVRTSYLLANSKAVVSECGPRTEIDDDIRRAMVAVPYEHLVTSCVALVRDELRRRELEQLAFEVFAKRDQAKILRETIAATDMPTFG